MIAYIEGKLEQKDENSVVIDNNGLGYEIFVSNTTISQLPLLNEYCRLFTYMQVKEDGVSLFGFISKEEKQLFLQLISISGIGPKNAMAILSGYSLSDLTVAIASGNAKMLSKIKGLGAKTAERVILELKDKVSLVRTDDNADVFDNLQVVDEATETLISLGINKTDAYKLAKMNANENSSVEEIITKVLRGMGR